MKQIIHVAQEAIRKNDAEHPPIIVRDYKGTARYNEVELTLADGMVVGKFVYRPSEPLSCGARLWLELNTDVCTARPA